MSGGHWDYRQHQLEELLSDIGNDKSVQNRFPKLAVAFKALSKALEEVIHDIDWDFCGDSSIKNDRVFEELSLSKLGILFAILKDDKLIRKIKTVQENYEKEIFEIIDSRTKTQAISDKINNDPDWEPLD